MTGNYSIQELEKLTSIKAHTIRIWEKRYRLLSPSRTNTNIRYYSNEDLRKLLNVVTLMKGGRKISHISRLSDKQVKDELQELHRNNTEPEEYLPSVHRTMMMALIEYNEENFNKAFNHAISKLGFTEAVVKVIYPVLDKIGLLWNTGEIVPAQEHFISNLIRQKISSATEFLPAPSGRKESFLLFLPEAEFHELPLLLANYMIRASGRKTFYLGQSVPPENVVETFKACQPGKLLLSVITPRQANELKNYLKKLLKQCKDTQVFLCGNQQLLDSIKIPEKVRWLKSVDELQSILK